MSRPYKLEVVHVPASGVGPRPPILMVHGGWHGAWCWEEHFMPYFSRQGYPCYAFSFRGHGGSEGAGAPMRTHTIRDYVTDLASVVADLPAPPVILAHSFGGFVLQHYLANATPRAAILLTPVPPTGLGRITWRAAVAYPFRFVYIHMTQSLRHLVGNPQLARDLLFSDDMPAEKVRAYQSKMSDESYRAFLDGLILNRPRPVKPTIPCMVIGAAHDELISEKEVERTAEFLGVEPIMIEDIAHDVMLERNWREVADRILAFLQIQGI